MIVVALLTVHRAELARFRAYEAFAIDRARAHGGALERVIELAEPDATLLAVMALPTVAAVCPSAGTTYDPDFSRKACGAGPFKLKRWEPGVIIQVERFEGYYAPDLVHLDDIVAARLSWRGLEAGLRWLRAQRRFFNHAELQLGHLTVEADLVSA